MVKGDAYVGKLNKPLQPGEGIRETEVKKKSRENLLCKSMAYELGDAIFNNEFYFPFLHCDVLLSLLGLQMRKRKAYVHALSNRIKKKWLFPGKLLA